jgi:hypothetical protein
MARMTSTDAYKVVDKDDVLGTFPLNGQGREAAEKLLATVQEAADAKARAEGRPTDAEKASEVERHLRLWQKCCKAYDDELADLGFQLTGMGTWTMHSDEKENPISFSIFLNCDSEYGKWTYAIALFSKDKEGEWTNIGDEGTIYLPSDVEFLEPVGAAKLGVKTIRETLGFLLKATE